MAKFYKISEELLSEYIKYMHYIIALQHGGIENWEWYEDSVDDYYSDKTEDELVESSILELLRQGKDLNVI